jgi:uncharacterized protein involved in outer membrane biogenesis
MALRRVVTIALCVTGALLLAIVLYLAFGDLTRHKGRIESFVTESIGRPFAIDGAFALQVLPSISVLAERIRVGNAEWGSKPQMIEIGRFATKIGLWSLLVGPVDVRSLELSDVSILLEKDSKGTGNWVFGDAAETGEGADDLGPGAAEVPAVIQHGKLDNVRVTYREPKTPDRVALMETFTIASGSTGQLEISGKGRIDDYPATVTGDAGPLNALVSGRNIRMAIQGAVGNLRLEIKGGLGRLDPLDGADLTVKIENPDLGTMLKKLRLPVFATGALSVNARLADAGELTKLDLDAKLGDITAKVNGTLRTLGLPGSDLRLEASVADAARLAAAFDVTGLPAEALEANGRVTFSRTQINLDGINARYAGAKAKADGTIRLARATGIDIRFDLAAESLARLRGGLPEMPFTMNGSYARSRDKDELKDLKGRIGESDISGRVSINRAGSRHIDVELASPRIDLTPLLAKAKDEAGKTKPKPTSKETQAKFIFDEAPLPLDPLKGVDARLHLVAAEVVLARGSLRDVDSTLIIEGGRLALEGRTKDRFDGTVKGSVRLAVAGGGAADLQLKVDAKGLRTGLVAGGAVEPDQTPSTSVVANLVARGASARQMASSASGRVLVTQGPGKVESGTIGMFGGDLLGQLASRLNPFAAQDPHMQLECTIARVDIVDGQATIGPVLVQSDRVAIIASGKVDLHTEALRFDFNTRPRRGVGVSAGMFANPFIEIAGTLASPRLGVSAKGTAAAAATGGLTVLAQGLVDRVLGQQDLCKQVLDEATKAAK